MSYEEKIAEVVSTLRSWLIVVTAAVFVLIGISVWAILEAKSANDNIAAQARGAAQIAHEAQQLARTSKQLAQAIASERRDAISRSCQQQNARHHGTVKELHKEISQVAARARPAQRRQIRASQKFTVLLIDQLAPLQDCRRLVRLEAKR